MTRHPRVLRKLELELEHLKQTFDFGRELQIGWLPGYVRHTNGRRLLGEVVNRTIFIYAELESDALKVLRHEFIENIMVSKFVGPYKQLVNALLAAFEQQVYTDKEKVIKKLVSLLWGEAEQRRGETDDGGGEK